MGAGRYKPEKKPGCENNSSKFVWNIMKMRNISGRITVEEDAALKNHTFLKSVEENMQYPLQTASEYCLCAAACRPRESIQR